MTDEQPADPAAGAPRTTPDPTRVDTGPAAPPAEAAAPGDESPDPAPARWSGSAAVPAPVAKRPWWSRRGEADPEPAPPADPWADSEDWSATPAVDPWADQDTPWEPQLPFPEALPPTRVESALPPTRMEAPLPPTRTEPPLPPTRMEAPPAPLPPAQAEALLRRAQAQPPGHAPAPPRPTWVQLPVAGPPAAAPPPPAPSPPRRRGWGRRRPAAQPAPAPANRIPVQSRPAPPPPPARPAQGRPTPPGPPPPPRRQRRRPRRLLTLALLGLLCCGGVPAYLSWPAARQYPVSAALPREVSDLELRDDGAGRRAVERLSEQLSGSSLIEGDVFSGVYADGNGKRVTVFGATGLRLTPESDVEAEIAHLAGEYDIKDVQSFDLGETGAHERCGVGRSGGKGVVVCAWADHGSLATVLLTRRSVEESADLTGVLRSAALTRG
ncbi:hypothetical protein GCM10020358_35290 [Amorphoplanes nipponensis]|uniref:Uncharacterized protein n=1 Tax=Actinoplanes nipponensis TaxID=135950 RepID=A0A919JJI4_9ACTN|nr:hypothetical protein [Actinoplanes nipponensis]GIE50828.1 hypothetical protein Ani05nite_43620 [Actinoplanes nipponensis]